MKPALLLLTALLHTCVSHAQYLAHQPANINTTSQLTYVWHQRHMNGKIITGIIATSAGGTVMVAGLFYISTSYNDYDNKVDYDRDRTGKILLAAGGARN